MPLILKLIAPDLIRQEAMLFDLLNRSGSPIPVEGATYVVGL